ncbi:MAG: DUF4405 domain-containing protein, partial [Rhodospirillales bacterium]|nr:DUF4405 domain-containing protein [Rhodospirillales bacterium]
MNRQRLHLAVDITMFICGLGVIATGLLIYFVLPPGSHGDTVWSLTRHDWGDWHFYIALALLATVMLHLLLNWNWVCNVVCKMVGVKPGRGGWGRKLAGALALAIIVGLVGGFVLLAGQAKQIGQPGDGEGR